MVSPFPNLIESLKTTRTRRRESWVRAVSRNEAAHSGKNTLPPKVAWKLIFVRSRRCKFVRGRATYFDFTTFLSLKRQERTKEKEKVCEPPKKFFHKKFEMNLSPWIFLLDIEMVSLGQYVAGCWFDAFPPKTLKRDSEANFRDNYNKTFFAVKNVGPVNELDLLSICTKVMQMVIL